MVLVRAVAGAALVLLAGGLVSMLCMGVGIWLLGAGGGPGFHGAGAGGFGALVALVVLFRDHPWAMATVVLGAVGVVVQGFLAQKHLLQGVLRGLWNAGEARFLEAVVSRCLDAMDAASPGWMTGIVKWAAVKANLLAALGRDRRTPAVQRWALGRVLGKLPLEGDVPVDREGLARLLVERIRAFVSEAVAPSMLLPGIVAMGQILFALLAWWMVRG